MTVIRRIFTVLIVICVFPALGCTSSNDDKAEESSGNTIEIKESDNFMNLIVGETVLTATLTVNSTTEALKEMLSEGPVTIAMRDYGSMEKVGNLPQSLPRNDQQITTEAGDLILYQGNAFVIYYAPNSWNFTRIGKINDITGTELKKILGDGNVSVYFKYGITAAG